MKVFTSRGGRKALSEVQGALLSVVVTLALLGAFLGLNHNIILGGFRPANPGGTVQLLSILWTSVSGGNACIYVYNYGVTPINVAYAVVGSSTTPVPVSVTNLYTNQPASAIVPGYLFEVTVPLAGATPVKGHYYITLVTTQGVFYQISV